MGFIPTPSAALVGAGAGLASALGFFAIASGGSLALPLFLALPLPLVIASLGWGTGAGIVALVVQAGLIALLRHPFSALEHALLLTMPAVALSHVLGLARATGDADGTVEWFPVGRIMVYGALLVGGACLLAGWLAGLGNAEIWHDMVQAVLTASATNADPAVAAAMTQILMAVLPVLVPGELLLIVLGNLWLGALVVRMSERLARPPERLSEVELPHWATMALGMLLIPVFVGNQAAMLVAPFAGALLAVHMLIGLALVAVALRRSTARGFVLSLAWASTVLGVPVILFAILGVVDSIFRIRARILSQDPQTLN